MKVHGSCIYQIKNKINGKCYIGQTVDFQQRKLGHLSALRRGVSNNRHLQAAFNKYGEESFEFSILEFCDTSRLDDREEYWIEKKGSCYTGYNMNKGGSGRRGFQHSEETKEKISAVLKGRNFSEEARRRMSENHADVTGKKNPQYGIHWKDRLSYERQMEIKEKMSYSMAGENNPNYGKSMSEEQRKKLSVSIKKWYSTHENPQKGKKRPQLSGSLSPNSHKVMCLNTGVVYDTIKDAAAKCNVSASGISQCCSNVVKSSGKGADGEPLFWISYESVSGLSEMEIRELFQQKLAEQKQKKSQLWKPIKCLTTGELFSSMREACEKYNIDQSSLSGHCNKRRCLHGCGRHPETGELLQWERI